jgi:hypothetical protein
MLSLVAHAMTRKTIAVELSQPPTIDGKPVRYQSLWLLLRTWQCWRNGETVVPASALRSRFPGEANLRMLVSRAYGDFSGWGIEVGWGHRQELTYDLLNPRGRSQGPFWLSPSSARRLRVRLHGKPVDDATLESYLGQAPEAPANRDAVAHVMQDLGYWNQLALAMRMAQDGPSITGANAAHSFRAAGEVASDGFQSAFALLKEGLAWRRHGQSTHSSETLDRLVQQLERDTLAQPGLAAMACIARAWNAYSSGDRDAARTELDRLPADAQLRPVLRYNPRVRFEYHNLSALLYRMAALFGREPNECAQSALRAVDALGVALQAAWEAESADAAQDVAANTGWTLWLCWQQGMLDPERNLQEEEVQTQALRWIGLSEWICDRFGVGGNSAWNTIFVMRIARGRCLLGRAEPQPLTIARLRDATRPFDTPFSRAKGYSRWSTVANVALEEHDTGRAALGSLQVANLLLEAAWFTTWENGVCNEAVAAVNRLKRMLPGLRPAERRFFGESLATLPEALATHANDVRSAKTERKKR